jgi:hypothetical protein
VSSITHNSIETEAIIKALKERINELEAVSKAQLAELHALNAGRTPPSDVPT